MDALRDDTIRLAARLDAAGVSHELSVRERLGHSFLGFARMVDEARAALTDAGRFLSAAWSGQPRHIPHLAPRATTAARS